MKPASFTYHRAPTLDVALALLAQYGDDAKILAGGQSLVPMMNMRLAQPLHLIDINPVAGLDALAVADGTLTIGALTRHQALAGAPLVRAHCPILAAAAATIGHYAIRTRGSLGGSLVHADPAAQLPLIATLLGAELELLSARGPRILPAARFFAGVFTTALAPDELLTAMRAPIQHPQCGWGFRLMSRRSGDFAIAAAAAILSLDGAGRVASLRLAVAGGEPTPRALDDLAAAQHGIFADDAWREAVGAAAAAACAPIEDPRVPVDYRRELVAVLVARALADAQDRAVRQLDGRAA